MSYATNSTVKGVIKSQENQIQRLENELRKLQGRPSVEEENEAQQAEYFTNRPPFRTAAHAAHENAMAQARAAEESWLSQVGIAADADLSLKRAVLSHRFLNVADQAVFSRLAFSIAGKKCKEEWPGVIQFAGIWDMLPEEVREPLTAALEAYHSCVVTLNARTFM
jgi:hypothetical protein